jgi:translation initiation factor 1
MVLKQQKLNNRFDLTYFNMKNTNIVYSTDNSIVISDDANLIKTTSPNKQHVRLHLDRKGGGKVVTVIKGLLESKETILSLSTELKKKSGAGGGIKNNEILIQGNKRDFIQKELIKKGYNVKLSGG